MEKGCIVHVQNSGVQHDGIAVVVAIVVAVTAAAAEEEEGRQQGRVWEDG